MKVSEYIEDMSIARANEIFPNVFDPESNKNELIAAIMILKNLSQKEATEMVEFSWAQVSTAEAHADIYGEEEHWIEEFKII